MLATALKRHVGKCILDFVRIKFIATKKSKHKTVSLNLTPLLEITPVPADMYQNIWFYLIWLSGLILFTLLPYRQFLWYHWECSEWYMSMRRYGINLQVPNQYLRSWSSEGLQLDCYFNTKILSNLRLQMFTYNNSVCSWHVNKHQVICINKLFQKMK